MLPGSLLASDVRRAARTELVGVQYANWQASEILHRVAG